MSSIPDSPQPGGDNNETLQNQEATGNASHKEVLQLMNGSSVPLEVVPVLSFSNFSHWLTTMVRSGFRLSSLFAVPDSAFFADSTSRPNVENENKSKIFRLFAVLTANQSSKLLIASSEISESFPSLTPRIPEAHLFEREIYEKYGIVPEDHPWLKPVRFNRTGGPEIGSMDFFTVGGDEVHEVAVGPIHAGVIECGHFRFQCLGEIVMHLEISLGYHHRGVEKLLLQGPDKRSLSLLEAVSGDSTIAHTWAYCALIESLTECEPKPCAQLSRSLALELERLANHTGDIGAMAGDVGFLSTSSFCGRLRGDWLNMTGLLCGSRFGRGFLKPGGVFFDWNKNLILTLKERLTRTARDVEGAIRLIWDSPSMMARLSGIGTLPTESAEKLGLVGVAARASGLARDVRTTHPLQDLPVAPEICLEKSGDVRARMAVRHREITESVVFCQRLLGEFLDAGDEPAPESCFYQIPLAPTHIAVAMVEGWRGEICHVCLTDSQGKIAAYQITDPSFHNWLGLAMALREQQISDFPLCNKSFNLSYCGHDL